MSGVLVEKDVNQADVNAALPGVSARPVVLHVDDDMASLIMAEGALEDAGFTVVQASNGEEAISRYTESSPDLVIMDAVMPVMDGFDAIAAIRKDPNGQHVPILMITGLDDLDSITRAYDEGATDFLTKPINFFILPHRVQYMLRSTATADALRASEAKLDNAQRIAKMGHWEWSLDSDELSFSQGFVRTLLSSGHPDSSEWGRPIQQSMSWQDLLACAVESDRTSLEQAAVRAVDRSEAFSVEFSIQRPEDDECRTIRLEAEPHLGPGDRCTHMLGTVQDITERLDAQAQIHNLAYYDIVTGLPNRAQLLKSLNDALDRAERESSRFAVLFLDLDHFKQVNDTLGHDAGDLLLQQVANRINQVLRDSDLLAKPGEDLENHTVARLGGDEFVVLLDAIRRPEDSARVAQRIAAVLREPFCLERNEVSISTTIGISVYPADGKDSDTLLKHADVAMYHAKQRGRNGYQFYSRGIHERALDRFTLERDLKRAISNGDLSLVFQPKVYLSTGQISGCEALVRWNHAERGPINPAEFIPLAEETGLILPLGKWVVDSACKEMQKWHASGLVDFGVAINCSAVQFMRGNMEREIEAALLSSGLESSSLEIELTESLLMHDIEVGIASIQRMKALGVQVAIDDFGTGFSSLSYLKRLPADKLKIDRCFVEEMSADSGDAAIVAAVTRLSHDLGLSVVAEGVETAEQMEALRTISCDEAQGYLISKPLAADDFIEWVAETHAFGTTSRRDRAA